jgi:hypothetical protein
VKSVVTVLNPSPDDTPSLGGIDEIGDRIVYQVTVENTGPVNLDNVVVMDTSLTSPVALELVIGDGNILEPTETWVYQGEYAFTQADADADPNKVHSVCLDEVEAMLPDTIHLRLTRDGSIYSTAPSGADDSYFDGVLLNGNNSFLDGWANIFCLNSNIPIRPGAATTYTDVIVSSSYKTLPGFIQKPQNMDLVNWIINQDFVGTASSGGFGNFTGDDVQVAIWSLIENTPKLIDVPNYNQNRVDQIVNAALAPVNEGYTPGCGDQLVVILNPSVNGQQQQPLMTSVEIPCSGSITNLAEVTADVEGVTPTITVTDSATATLAFSVPSADQPAVTFNGNKTNYLFYSLTPTFAFLNNDTVVGGTGNDSMIGAFGNDSLQGGDGMDTLTGNQGNDILIGGRGADSMSGGTGNDQFIYNDPSDGADIITDFSAADDTIALSYQGFNNNLDPPSGTLTASNFTNTSFTNTIQRILYTGGVIYYDADGNGTEFDPIALATLQSNPTISNSNFTVF